MIADERSNIDKRRKNRGDRPPCWFGRCRRRRSYSLDPSKVNFLFGFYVLYAPRTFGYKSSALLFILCTQNIF